jgi:hypothetical protein
MRLSWTTSPLMYRPKLWGWHLSRGCLATAEAYREGISSKDQNRKPHKAIQEAKVAGELNLVTIIKE